MPSDFIESMGGFIRNERLLFQIEEAIDRRYLYEENARGQIVCGITREALASLIHNSSQRLPLPDS